MKPKATQRLTRAALSLLLGLCSTGAWATNGTLAGSGTVGAPYEIADLDDWNEFASDINEGRNADKYYKLMANIGNTSNPIILNVGYEDHPFSGHFDGAGHTIYVKIERGSVPYTAPFLKISDATIENLTVEGKVNGSTCSAGLVGFSQGNNTIKNCVIKTYLDVRELYVERHVGGVVGYGDVNSTLTLENVVFSGSLTNTSHYGGGLVCLCGDGMTLNLKNCLYKGSQHILQLEAFHPIAIKEMGKTVTATVENCYYTEQPTLTNTACIAATGQFVSKSHDNVIYKQVTAADGETWYVNALISGVQQNYRYTGQPIAINYSVNDGSLLAKGDDYEETITKGGNTVSEVKEQGTYTLTVSGKGDYTGSQTFTFSVANEVTVTSSTTVFEDGVIYNVTQNVEIPTRIEVRGVVTLNLGEGATLTASKGIELAENNELTINGPGSLVANGYVEEPPLEINYSGIGALLPGKLTINSGTITATSGRNAAAIGSSYANGLERINTSDKAEIIINGGIVNASVPYNGAEAAAIGGGYNRFDGSNGGKIYILGGQVTARGGSNSPGGIGSGGKVNVNTGDKCQIVLGYTNATDFIDAKGFNYADITFEEGKDLIVVGKGVKATAENIGYNKLVPATGANLKDLNNLCVEVAEYYDWTGNAVHPTPVVKVYDGTVVDASKYNVTYSAEAQTLAGIYQLTIAPTTGSEYTGSNVVNYEVSRGRLLQETDGSYYVNMPATGSKTVTIPDDVTTFKIYDDGGKNKSYSFNANGALLLTAPQGRVIKLTGTVRSYPFERSVGRNVVYGTTFYDGSAATSPRIGKEFFGGYNEAENIGTLCSTGENMYMTFDAGYYAPTDGLNLTAEVVTPSEVTLYNTTSEQQNNNSILESNNGKVCKVTISGRTFTASHWNTLCLPFDVNISGSVFNGADIRQLEGASFSNNELTLTFSSSPITDKIVAGKPYIVKPTAAISDPVVFNGVTIVSSNNDKSINLGGGKSITFKGTYASLPISATNTILYLSTNDNLYYPNQDITINAFRAYFELSGLQAGTSESVRSWVMNFGDEEQTGITTVNAHTAASNAGWYSIDGRKVQEGALEPGLYIHDGKKVFINK